MNAVALSTDMHTHTHTCSHTHTHIHRHAHTCITHTCIHTHTHTYTHTHTHTHIRSSAVHRSLQHRSFKLCDIQSDYSIIDPVNFWLAIICCICNLIGCRIIWAVSHIPGVLKTKKSGGSGSRTGFAYLGLRELAKVIKLLWGGCKENFCGGQLFKNS